MSAEDTTMTQPQPPPQPTAPPRPPLRRSRTDRKLAGVAGGLGAYGGVDPLIFRILFVVLTVFGGSGLLLYALGWLLIPDEGQQESEGQKVLRGRSTSATTTVLAVVLVLVVGVIGARLVFGDLGGLELFVVVTVGVIVALLLRSNERPAADQVPGDVHGPVPPPGEPGAYGQTTGTAYAVSPSGQGPAEPPPTWPTAPLPPPPPAPPREKSILGRVTVSVALILVGLMVGWNSMVDNQSDFRAVAISGVALAVVGGGLLVGAVRGRARGLIVLGVVLTLVTGAIAAADSHVSGGIGERRWTPLTAEAAEREFHLGVGDARLDLTRLPAGSDVTVDVRLGVGELRVIVPPDAAVDVTGEVGAGTMRLLDQPSMDGTDLMDTARVEPPSTSGTDITVKASVGLGDLEVQR